jgi:seryl-tRNA synthetase
VIILAINEDLAKLQLALKNIEVDIKEISIELGILSKSQIGKTEHSILLTRFDTLSTDFRELCKEVKDMRQNVHQLELNTINKTDHQVLVAGMDGIKLTMAKYLGGFAVIIFVAEWYFRSH